LLASADAVAALIVALIVVFVSFQLGKRAVMALLDTAPKGLTERVIQEARQVPGVEEITAVRMRESGPAVFLDLTATVDRSKSLEEAHEIATAVEEHVRTAVPDSDVVVHIDPGRAHEESLEQTLSALAAQQSIRLHNMHAHLVGRQVHLDLHAELDDALTLGEARQALDHFEKLVRAEVPSVGSVNVHLEPRQAPVVTAAPTAKAISEVKRALREVLADSECPDAYHNLQVRQTYHDGLDVVIHCTADPGISVEQAHHMADHVERGLRERLPGLGQVLVQMEDDFTVAPAESADTPKRPR
jgi:divalent metal cation (Fe/Co/Zn/Cd) transporter